MIYSQSQSEVAGLPADLGWYRYCQVTAATQGCDVWFVVCGRYYLLTNKIAEGIGGDPDTYLIDLQLQQTPPGNVAALVCPANGILAAVDSPAQPVTVTSWQFGSADAFIAATVPISERGAMVQYSPMTFDQSDGAGLAGDSGAYTVEGQAKYLLYLWDDGILRLTQPDGTGSGWSTFSWILVSALIAAVNAMYPYAATSEWAEGALWTDDSGNPLSDTTVRSLDVLDFDEERPTANVYQSFGESVTIDYGPRIRVVRYDPGVWDYGTNRTGAVTTPLIQLRVRWASVVEGLVLPSNAPSASPLEPTVGVSMLRYMLTDPALPAAPYDPISAPRLESTSCDALGFYAIPAVLPFGELSASDPMRRPLPWIDLGAIVPSPSTDGRATHRFIIQNAVVPFVDFIMRTVLVVEPAGGRSVVTGSMAGKVSLWPSLDLYEDWPAQNVWFKGQMGEGLDALSLQQNGLVVAFCASATGTGQTEVYYLTRTYLQVDPQHPPNVALAFLGKVPGLQPSLFISDYAGDVFLQCGGRVYAVDVAMGTVTESDRYGALAAGGDTFQAFAAVSGALWIASEVDKADGFGGISLVSSDNGSSTNRVTVTPISGLTNVGRPRICYDPSTAVALMFYLERPLGWTPGNVENLRVLVSYDGLSTWQTGKFSGGTISANDGVLDGGALLQTTAPPPVELSGGSNWQQCGGDDDLIDQIPEQWISACAESQQVTASWFDIYGKLCVKTWAGPNQATNVVDGGTL